MQQRMLSPEERLKILREKEENRTVASTFPEFVLDYLLRRIGRAVEPSYINQRAWEIINAVETFRSEFPMVKLFGL